MNTYTHIFSVGYRCSSAGILKSLGFKHASYPFDWLVSRLPIIEHCLSTEFVEFLNKNNYTKKQTATHGYATADPESKTWVCDESIQLNNYYETTFSYDKMDLHMASHLSPDRDAYSHKLMMNHHDITTDRDFEYYQRCINRWNQMLETAEGNALSLYIHPMIFREEFIKSGANIQMDIRRIHRVFRERFRGKSNLDGIYIIPVKTEYKLPTKHCAKYVLEEQPDEEDTPSCRICILWANSGFVDAGEIFMGDCGDETYVIQDYLQKTVANGALLENSNSR